MRRRRRDNEPVATPKEARPCTEALRVCPEPFMRATRSYKIVFNEGRSLDFVADGYEIDNGFVNFWRRGERLAFSGTPMRSFAYAVPKKRVRSIEAVDGEELFTPDCYTRNVPCDRYGF